ncbi:syntaxin-61-like [Hibiscus syriacus]|uniref:syntaxin-61-like n=1 Tax=Hibiscus syriacus TaxID=106335 RepID=UPI0019229D0E|nr:syntaxin-61-like [Hibiscus syriacus]
MVVEGQHHRFHAGEMVEIHIIALLSQLKKQMCFTSVVDVKKAVGAGKENDRSASAIRRELMRLPNSQQPDMPDHYSAKNTDDFIASESDRQTLLIKQQEEELEDLRSSVQRIGDVGLTIHKELFAQENILDGLGTEMDSRKNQLDFVQRKMAIIMNKAGAKGQIMIIIFLLVLFILVFFIVYRRSRNLKSPSMWRKAGVSGDIGFAKMMRNEYPILIYDSFEFGIDSDSDSSNNIHSNSGDFVTLGGLFEPIIDISELTWRPESLPTL